MNQRSKYIKPLKNIIASVIFLSSLAQADDGRLVIDANTPNILGKTLTINLSNWSDTYSSYNTFEISDGYNLSFEGTEDESIEIGIDNIICKGSGYFTTPKNSTIYISNTLDLSGATDLNGYKTNGDVYLLGSLILPTSDVSSKKATDFTLIMYGGKVEFTDRVYQHGYYPDTKTITITKSEEIEGAMEYTGMDVTTKTGIKFKKNEWDDEAGDYYLTEEISDISEFLRRNDLIEYLNKNITLGEDEYWSDYTLHINDGVTAEFSQHIPMPVVCKGTMHFQKYIYNILNVSNITMEEAASMIIDNGANVMCRAGIVDMTKMIDFSGWKCEGDGMFTIWKFGTLYLPINAERPVSDGNKFTISILKDGTTKWWKCPFNVQEESKNLSVTTGEAYAEFDNSEIGITFKEIYHDESDQMNEKIKDIAETDLNSFLTSIEDISISDMVRLMSDDLNNSANTLAIPAENVLPKIDSTTKANFNITIGDGQNLEVTRQFIMNGKLTINTGGEISVIGSNAKVKNSQPIENSGTIKLTNFWTIYDVVNKNGGVIDLSLINRSDTNDRTITCEHGSKVIMPIYIAPGMINQEEQDEEGDGGDEGAGEPVTSTTIKVKYGATIERYQYEPTIDDEGNIIVEDRSVSGYEPSKWGIKFVDDEEVDTTPYYRIINDKLNLSDFITVINDSPYDEPYTLDLSQEGIKQSLNGTSDYVCNFNLDLTNMTDLSELNSGDHTLIMRGNEDLTLPKNPTDKATFFKIQMADGKVYYYTGEISVDVEKDTNLITVETDGDVMLLNNVDTVKNKTNITIEGNPTFIGNSALTISSLVQDYDSTVNQEGNILDLTKTVGLIKPIIDKNHDDENSINFAIRTTQAMGITIASDISITAPVKIQLKLAGV